MFKISLNQVIYEVYLVFDSLEMFFLWIRGDSHRVFILLVWGVGLEGVILRGFQ